MNARSEGPWVDAGTDVVIVGGHTGYPVVRAVSENMVPVENHGQELAEHEAPKVTPLHAPPARVERINAVALGVGAGFLAIPFLWMTGTSLSVSAALVPCAGGIAGRLFQAFVKVAIDSAAPREDHRPAAVGIAGMVVICAVIGAVIGFNVGTGFVGLSLGLLIGTLAGGMLAWLGLLLLSL